MRRRYETPLWAAILEVTNRCNLRCPHCASDSGQARQNEMSLAEMRSLVRGLAELGCHHVTLLGGEFLLRSDWAEIGAAVKDAGMELKLITNGLLATPEVRSQIKRLDPAVVGVSIDGATPESYRAARGVDGYAKCRRLLDDLVSDGIRQVSAITTATSANLGDFDAFVSEFIDTQIVWQVQVAHRAGRRFDSGLLLSREQYELYVEKVTDALSRYNGRLRLQVMDDFGYFPLNPKLAFLCQTWDGCPAGRKTIGIRANGDVMPCLSLDDSYVMYNVRSRSVVDIWRDPKSFPGFRDRRADQLTGKCAKCPMAGKCKAGCSAAAVSTTGTLTENLFCIRRVETEKILNDML